MCDCVKEVESKLAEQYKQPVQLNTDLCSGRVLVKYFYDKKNSRGNIKQVDGYLMLSNCPFCGQKYVKESET